jgi:TonB-linked SusC/RagA family outer membrane protein
MKTKFIQILTLSFMMMFQWSMAQQVVSGTVTDADGIPLPGATVVVQGTTNGTSTDFDGNYSISASQGDVLAVSFVGYGAASVEVGASATINVTLSADNQLNEVVVTALGITREKKSLGYAVQTINGDAIGDVQAFNPVESLSGEVAGLDIQSFNTMGGSANVVIRGYSSISGSNQALFVVDGTPISNSTPNSSTVSGGQGGFDYGNAAMDINPEDIASVSVLKGAAASALYGSRASNGAILITTKKGKVKSSGLGITVSSQLIMGTVDESTLPSYQYEYGQGYGGNADGYYLDPWDGTAVVNTTDDASFGPKLTGQEVHHWYNMIPELTDLYQKTAPDNPGAPAGTVAGFFNTQVTSTNSVAFEGANDSGNFRLRYTNASISGILPNASIDRNSFNFSGSQMLRDDLRVSAGITYTNTDATGRYGTGYDGQNVFQGFRQWWGTTIDLNMDKKVYDQTGGNYSWNMFGMDTSGTTPDTTPHYFNNPYWMRDHMYNTDNRNRYFGNFAMDYELNENIKLLGRASFDQYDFVKEERIDVGSVDVSRYYVSHRTASERNYDFIASYNKDINDRVNIDGNIGWNLRVQKWDYMTAETNGGLNIPGLYALSNSANPITSSDVSNYDATKKVDGIYGRLSVGIDDTYFVEATYRSDRSSALPKANNRYNYPSISGSVILSNLFDSSIVDFAKFRANYAEVGADTDPYRVFQSYVLVAGFDGQPQATNPSTFNNESLKAESTKEFEFGLELDLYKNRLGLDISVYDRTTEDLITPLQISNATGGNAFYVNAGSVQNKGVELVLNANPVRLADFNWDITANWSTYSSEVIELGKDASGNEIEYLNFADLQGGISIGAKKGDEYGVIRGTDFIYHENGQKIKTSAGAYDSTDSNTEVLGSIIPDWTGGIKNKFTYKNLSASFLIDIQKGGDVFSLDARYSSLTGILAESTRLNANGVSIREPVADGGGVLLPGVNADGTPNEVYGEAGDYLTVEGYVYMPAANYVYDASFVKLREVSIGYAFPDNLIERTFIESANVSLIGRNLWIIHSNVPYSDPEAGLSAGNIQGYQSGAYPNIKEIGLSLKLQF